MAYTDVSRRTLHHAASPERHIHDTDDLSREHSRVSLAPAVIWAGWLSPSAPAAAVWIATSTSFPDGKASPSDTKETDMLSPAHARTVAAPAARLNLAPLRRAHIRLQARSTTRRMIAEMISGPEPRHDRRPLFVRLDALSARYRALGGDPADLVR